MRSVSILLSLIVIITVTLVVAIAATGILLHWYEWSLTHVPAVHILPDSSVVVTSAGVEVRLHIENTGGARGLITEVDVAGREVPIDYFTYSVEVGFARRLQAAIEIGPDSRIWLNATLPPGYISIPTGASTVTVTLAVNYGSQRVSTEVSVVWSG